MKSCVAPLPCSMRNVWTTGVPGKPYCIYFLLHGVIQHNLYHAGQIACLKKA